MDSPHEIYDILDQNGTITGQASRSECHSGTFFLHGVVHVLVFHTNGQLYLQKRSLIKDIEPGKWDTSVGGHILSGETVEQALYRETFEELGIVPSRCERLYSYVMKNDVEHELAHTFRCIWNGGIRRDVNEIEEVRLFSHEEIESHFHTGFFTPNFEEEWRRYHSSGFHAHYFRECPDQI